MVYTIFIKFSIINIYSNPPITASQLEKVLFLRVPNDSNRFQNRFQKGSNRLKQSQVNIMNVVKFLTSINFSMVVCDFCGQMSWKNIGSCLLTNTGYF